MTLFLFLDYDGTLTPIVERPELAVLPRGRKDILRHLSQQQGTKLFIISGRKLADLKKRVGIPGVVYVGNHGLEILIGKRYFIHPKAKKFLPVLKKIKSKLANKLHIKGVIIEDKTFTLSIHYRLVKPKDLSKFLKGFRNVMQYWENKVRITKGKKVLEIRPPFPWDKGKAIKWLIQQQRVKNFFPIYIGDDTTDEDAFRILKGKGLTILVGKNKKTLAEYRLQDVNEVYLFLRSLLKLSKFAKINKRYVCK